MALLHVAVNCYTSRAGIMAPHVYIERGTVGGLVGGGLVGGVVEGLVRGYSGS